MKQAIYEFRSKSGIIGPERVMTLQKTIASAIAYAVPIMPGQMSDAGKFYQEVCYPIAIEVISKVNEEIVINVDNVLEDVKTLWIARYFSLNSPLANKGFMEFHQSLHGDGYDIRPHYERWVEFFYAYITKHFVA